MRGSACTSFPLLLVLTLGQHVFLKYMLETQRKCHLNEILVIKSPCAMLYKGIDLMSPSFVSDFRANELTTVATRNTYMPKLNGFYRTFMVGHVSV